MRKWILRALATIAGLVVLTALVGLALPRGHQARRTVALAAEPSRVFDVISDFLNYPQWRPDVTSVTVEGAGGVGTLVREDGADGPLPYRIEVFEPPTRLVARIADPSLPFGGTWTYELRAAGSGTELTLTEDGEVYNPIFRVMQALLFSPTATLDRYIANLEARLAR